MPITQTITVLPTPPSRADPENFDSRADAFLSALPTMQTQMNTWASQANQTAQEVGIVQEGLLSETPGAGQVPLADENGKIANGWLDLDADLTALGSLAKADGNIIVGDGTTWVAESGAAARTSLGLGTTDNPEFLTVDPTNGVRVTNENTTAGVGNAPLYTCFSTYSGAKTFYVATASGSNQGFKIHFPVASFRLSGSIWLRGDYSTNNAQGLLTYYFYSGAYNSDNYGTDFSIGVDLGATADYISLHSITHTTNDHVFEFRRTGSNAMTFICLFNVISEYWSVSSRIADSWFETFTYT